MKYLLILVLCLSVSPSSMALTSREREILTHAREYLIKAKDDAHRQQALMEEADRRAQEAETHAELSDQHAADTDTKIGVVSQQIETAHKNEQDLGKAVAKYKPVYDKVTRYWGIGGILFGFGLLAKHLLILAAVLIGLAAAVWIASFFFPVIGVGLSLAWSFLSSVFSKLGSILKKKE